MKIENVGLYFFPIRTTFCNVFLNYSTHCAQISWWWTGIYRAQTTRTVPHLSSGGLCQNCHFQTKLKSISNNNILEMQKKCQKEYYMVGIRFQISRPFQFIPWPSHRILSSLLQQVAPILHHSQPRLFERNSHKVVMKQHEPFQGHPTTPQCSGNP